MALLGLAGLEGVAGITTASRLMEPGHHEGQGHGQNSSQRRGRQNPDHDDHDYDNHESGWVHDPAGAGLGHLQLRAPGA